MHDAGGHTDRARLRILYVFTGGRKQRWRAAASGQAPGEFLLGAVQLDERGHQVEVLELADLRPERIVTGAVRRRWREWTGIANAREFIAPERLPDLRRYDAVVAGNDYIALGLASRLPPTDTPPLLFFAMGMLARVQECSRAGGIGRFFGRREFGRLLQRAGGAWFLGAGEFHLARALFPESCSHLRLRPFPVDTGFWTPGTSGIDDYILFVGNDARRDYRLLRELAHGLAHRRFLCITGQVSASEMPPNCTLLRGDWKQALLSDRQMLEHFRRAALVIVPVLPTMQPSGQSVANQAMACARPVLISAFPGFWAPTRLSHERELVIVPDNRLQTWRETIEHAFARRERMERMGRAARSAMERYFNLEDFAAELETHLYRLAC